MSIYTNDPQIEELCMSALETQRLLEKAAALITWYNYYKQTGRTISNELSDDLCDFAGVLTKFGYGI